MDYKLTYFPAKGRGEVIRILLSLAGEEFEDERISGEDWAKFKPQTPLKAMPVLSMKGRPLVCQTNAICRYLARKYGFYGCNPWEELLVDEVVEAVQDLVSEKVKAFFEKDENKKAELAKSFLENTLPKFLDYFRLRSKDAKNGYIVGSKITLADVMVFSFVDMQFSTGQTFFEEYPEIMKHYELIKSNPKIAAWLETRPAD